ncbi:hypothetical protein D9758_012293 [Tetrapyrgos nigripes]|uniref:Carboxylesterase type B domain-containing protein n=1 Tax=Tetrapyrgos nigripes TaxID=182062 RepID=A0A8H5CII1_9AGAR|nr:hypothetical protein D9758_012293 [Tetrapyrgos nigripes]
MLSTVFRQLLAAGLVAQAINGGLAASIPAQIRTDAGDIVDTGYAKYQGNHSLPHTVAYLGIPYAEPPVGDRRFRAPASLNETRVAAETNGQVVDATEYPDFCIQGPIGFGDQGGAGSEDCLNINVYAPAEATKDSNFPVLVYFHGGGYTSGNPHNWPYDHWIEQSPNVVVASVYYRLDSFGFLSHPDFDGTVADNNVGLLDQVEALKWVQKNIASFGGNPGQVTINGESAGGGSVLFHLVAHEEPELFHGAISQSVARGPTPLAEQKAPLFDFFTNFTGCATGSLADQVGCLRQAEISTLARAQEAAISFSNPYNGFGPIVDGKLIVDTPTQSILKGDFKDVPLIVGATSNETFTGGDDLPGTLRQLYPGLDDQDVADFEARESLGSLFSKPWTYRYNQPNPTQGSPAVQHAAENWMMFQDGCLLYLTHLHLPLQPSSPFCSTNGTAEFTSQTPVELAFVEELVAYWLSFVRALDPNTHKLERSPVWEGYADETRRIVLQQDPKNSTTTSGSFVEQQPERERERCLFVQTLRSLAFPFALLAAVFNLAASAEPGPNVVDLGYVQYRGNLSFPDTVAYLGIPYAEPPLGDRRFRKPLPLNTSRITQEAGGIGKVVDASVYPDFCIQGTTGGGDAGGAGSEDCLKINVYAPAGAKRGDKLPVLVYIHGGGYIFGNPANWPFNHWIHQSPNVVIASVYYRLSSFGFLATPAFEDSAVGDFNVGFQDQTQALKWLEGAQSASILASRKTIQLIFNHSPELHLVAEGQEGLFTGAIAQSVYRTPTPEPVQMQPLFDFYSEHAGCPDGSIAEKVACLRKASVSALAMAQDLASSSAFNGSYKAFHPVVDRKIITDVPTNSLVKGHFAKVPVIVGATSNETGGGGATVPDAIGSLFPLLTDKDLEEFAQQYPLEDFDSVSQQISAATGESIFRCGREALGNAYAGATKAWTYRYNQPNPTQQGNATQHAAENWMMFLGSNTGPNGTVTFTSMTPTETAFAEELIAYWLSFVRSGDPNTHKLHRSPSWNQYVTRHKQRIVLQQGPGTTTDVSGSVNENEPSLETRRCAFVVSKADKEQN